MGTFLISIKSSGLILLKFTGVILLTCFSHWFLVNTYSYYCVPPTILGVFQSIISLGSPVCQFINMLQYELARHYISIWATVGTALVTWLVAKNTITTSN
jgi:hypothetical protein|tara:strand:+ start:483 stop:782 length:300 start_codon:yes stop_codon:yes gene_type:complete